MTCSHVGPVRILRPGGWEPSVLVCTLAEGHDGEHAATFQWSDVQQPGPPAGRAEWRPRFDLPADDPIPFSPPEPQPGALVDDYWPVYLAYLNEHFAAVSSRMQGRT